jgi:hypothetical protein
MDQRARQYIDQPSPTAVSAVTPAPGSRSSQVTQRAPGNSNVRRVDSSISPALAQQLAFGEETAASSTAAAHSDLPPASFFQRRGPALEYTWPKRTYDSLSGSELMYLEQHMVELGCGSSCADEYDRRFNEPYAPSMCLLDDGCQRVLSRLCVEHRMDCFTPNRNWKLTFATVVLSGAQQPLLRHQWPKCRPQTVLQWPKCRPQTAF